MLISRGVVADSVPGHSSPNVINVETIIKILKSHLKMEDVSRSRKMKINTI